MPIPGVMGSDPTTVVAAAAASPRARWSRPRGRAPVVDSMIGRRDVAIVPWAAMSVVALAYALACLLREGVDPAGQLPALLGLCAVAGLMVPVQDTTLGRRFRTSLPIYLGGAGALLAGIAVLAAGDCGVSSPVYGAAVPLASYLGLALPRRANRGSVAVIMATTLAIHLIAPGGTSDFDALVVGALVLAGWYAGTLGRLAHRRATQVAAGLAAYDPLTGMLNRRGILAHAATQIGAGLPASPIALLIVDLDDFKALNDAQGHAAGDALLAAIRSAMEPVLPAGAELGRLGGDEFAVLLPGAGQAEARSVGRDIRASLAPLVSASVGIATAQTRDLDLSDLLRVADAALYTVKADRSLGVHALVTGTSRPVEYRPPAASADRPALSFAQLRGGRRPADPLAPGTFFGTTATLGLLAIAGAGAVIVAGALFGDGHGLWNTLLCVLGIPWVLRMVAMAWYTHDRELPDGSRRLNVLFHLCNFDLATGVGVAMLAHGGLTAPIGAAWFLKVLFDAALMQPRYVRWTLAELGVCWLLVAVLGPASALWVVPLHLALFGASFALGSIAWRAFDDTTRHALDLARTDTVTGLLNRHGFEARAGEALAAARAADLPCATIALDLDDFKTINDSLGHLGGDRVLADVARVLQRHFPDAHAIGRLGGDEFALAVPLTGSALATRLSALDADLAEVAPGSSGHASRPADGDDLESLMRVADRRSYARKPGAGLGRRRRAAA